MPSLDLNGARFFPGWIGPSDQRALVHDMREIAAAAPFFRPVTARGKPLSVQMTSAGALGWVTDRRGYRYEARHPSGVNWPPIPASLLEIWAKVSGVERPPDSCLVNYYAEGARMGLHQDKDEADLGWPVVSVSLGDDALFRIGGTTRTGPTVSQRLSSGDVVVLSDAARLAFHGIDRTYPGTSTLLPKGGRINMTLRIAGA